MGIHVSFVLTYGCDRGCAHCMDRSNMKGASFDQDTLKERMRQLVEYVHRDNGAIDGCCITGGGEPLLSPATDYTANLMCTLTRQASLVTSGPATALEAERYERIQEIFLDAEYGDLMVGTEWEKLDSDRVATGTTVSVYDNDASRKRVALALDLTRTYMIARFVHWPFQRTSYMAQIRRLGQQIGWLNELIYSKGGFVVGLTSNSMSRSYNPALVLSGLATDLHWDKPIGENMALRMCYDGVYPMYWLPRDDIWVKMELQAIQPYGRAAEHDQSWLGCCSSLSSVEGYNDILIAPDGLKYCTSGKPLPFDDLQETVESRPTITKNARNQIRRNLRGHHHSLCDVCPLAR